MTLEAVVFKQHLISYSSKDHLHGYGIQGENWSYGYGFEENKAYNDERDDVQEACKCHEVEEAPLGAVMPSRRKRRRTRSFKNKDDVENQRMTHITVERNRRKQMNDYLSALRTLMPPSYVQRGDQASIVGGAINFVKELEQLLQSLESSRQINQRSTNTGGDGMSSIFSDFFTYPQYSTCSALAAATATESMSEMRSATADIEVTMVESHANIKILTKRHPKQLLKMLMRLQSLLLTILHLNMTSTVDRMVLYSISVKVEEGCHLTSVNEIATTLYEMVGLIQEEANFSLKP